MNAVQSFWRKTLMRMLSDDATAAKTMINRTGNWFVHMHFIRRVAEHRTTSSLSVNRHRLAPSSQQCAVTDSYM